MIDERSGTPKQPRWFWGIVEDTNDPEKLGRVRVRCYGIHTERKKPGETEGIPTEELHWAVVALPTTEAGVSGIGKNHGLLQGSQVSGFFRDGMSAQDPVVLFSVPGAPAKKPDPETGFNDPDGGYPREDRINEPDLNRLTRGDLEDSWIETERETLETGVGEDSWEEPDIQYSATFPANQVNEWPGGIIEEYDSTKEAVRWNRWHPAGTWEQWDSDGNRHLKTGNDDIIVVRNDQTLYVKTNRKLVIDGDEKHETGGDHEVFIQGSHDVRISGTSTVDVEGKSTLRAPEIQLGEDGAVEQSVLGKKLEEWINNELVPWLNTHSHVGNLGVFTSAAANGSIGAFDPGTAAPGAAVYSKVNTNQ